MHPALAISSTALDGLQTELAINANNLANANTVGFKRDRAVFEDLLYQNVRLPGGESSQNTELPSGLNIGTGSRVAATQKEFTQGSFQVTDNQLDVAIEGRGFFQVLLPDGTTSYTRAGNFGLDEDGQIVTAGNGFVVQPPITVPQDAQSLEVGIDGTVSIRLQGQPDPQNIGTLQLADFPNPAGLIPIGNNLFIESGSSGAPVVGDGGTNGLGNVRGGLLEGSNVSSVEELVNLITTQRNYEANARVLSVVDESLQFVNQTL